VLGAPPARLPELPPLRPAATPTAGPALDTPGAPRPRRILLGHDALDYRLRRARRRTIGFQIDDDGLTISAPRWVTVVEIESAIREKHRWIRRKLVEWRAWREKRAVPEVAFAEGGVVPYLGGHVVLRLRPAASRAQLHPTEEGPAELWLPLRSDSDEARIRDAVQAWLQNEARRILGDRLAVLAERIDTKPASWRLSSARSQWGACTSDGRIRLNWRLVHFTLPVIDYVVAHELAHLKELNHGPRFWQAVASLLPGFEAARDEIKAVDLAALPV
jgi:hypothetical protein